MMNQPLIELSRSIECWYNPKSHYDSRRDPRCGGGCAAVVVQAATINLQTRGLYAPLAKISVYVTN